MKQAVMKRWVAALRSKKYKQTRVQLRGIDEKGQPTNEFCCLGVLCDLFAKAHPTAKWLDRETTEDVLQIKMGGCAFSVADEAAVGGVSISAGILPAPVMRWADMADPNGEFELSDSERKRDLSANHKARYVKCLAELNDAALFNFEEIAEFVEKHWQAL